MYDLVIFDLDGTLLNTLGDLAAAGNYALGQMGKPPRTVDEFRRFIGNGIPKLIERMLPPDSTEAERETALRIFGEYYGAHNADNTVPYDGIPEALRVLRDNGVTCVCNTNKAHEFSAALMKRFFDGLITDVIGAGVGFPRKPSPEAALELCKRYSPRKNALYVGDSDVDMRTAANAGLDACGVLWGFRERATLAQHSPKHIISNPKELISILTE